MKTKTTNKKAQLSYEYIVVIGMVLILIIPFFYTYLTGADSKIGGNLNYDAVTRLAEATVTVANLGTGSMIVTPIRLLKVSNSSVENGTIEVISPAGEIESQGAAHFVAAGNPFTGTGFHFVPIQAVKWGAGVVGDKPAITYITKKGTTPSWETFGYTPTIEPSDGFTVHGGNFHEDSKVYIEKRTGPRTKEQVNIKFIDSMTLETKGPIKGGNAKYDVTVENEADTPHPGTSNAVLLDVKARVGGSG